MTGTRVLLAGDGFITPAVLSAALERAVPSPLALSTLELPWPHVPFGPVGEVREASGDESQLIEALRGVEVIVTQLAALTQRVLTASGSLRLVVVCRGGPVNVNVEAATARDILVCATPGRNAPAVAEHTLALTLAALRRVPEVHAAVLAGEWRGDLYALEACGDELAGETVGLIGYGAIGRRVARLFRAFGSRVLVYDPYVTDAETEDVQLVGVDELLGMSAVVSVHARATPETANLIGKRQLEAMRPGSVLVNTARGSLIDYEAVAAALHAGHLGAAAFDVFDEEPIPPHAPILRAPRVVLTPHLGGATRQTAHRAGTLAAKAVAAYLRGTPPPDVANPQVMA